jgi:Phage tail tube protein
MAGQRIGGTLYLMINGVQYPARGAWEYTPTVSQRTGVAGQDGVHGYIERPIVPSVKGDVSDFGGISIQALQQSAISVATLALANGKVVIGSDGWVKGLVTSTTEDGKYTLEIEFTSVAELSPSTT